MPPIRSLRGALDISKVIYRVHGLLGLYSRFTGATEWRSKNEDRS